MSDTLWLILAGLLLLVVLVAYTIVDERRTSRRFESMACPKCRALFGTHSFAIWGEHNNFVWYSRWKSGPLMTCKPCNRQFYFTWDGQLHAEQYENADGGAGVAARAHMESPE